MATSIKDTIQNIETLIKTVKASNWSDKDKESFILKCEVYLTDGTKHGGAIFQTSKSYSFGWIGDSEMKTIIKVLKKTAKFITIEIKGRRDERRCKIHNTGEGEFIYPLGRYSMCPICRACKEIKE